ncbi:bacterial surface protein [Paenibacillus medicaginis]|uniref:Bacterial surface protein n=1 Tax=Paenibacillus medicaginis TaxID=1470560 RepID=A0ABV5C8K5_9BACL
MKKFGKLFLIFTFVFSLFSGFSASRTYAASVGEQLLKAEDGWTRIDDSNSKLKYIGMTWNFTTDDSRFYDKTYSWSNNGAEDKIEFKFVGTSLRIIGGLRDNHSDRISITIDGETEYFSEYKKETSITIGQILVYEKLGLENTVHSVEIKRLNEGNFSLDAIDIDKNGELLDPGTPPAPTEPTEPEEPTNPTPGDPTTPELPSGNRAILVVTMTTGLEKEFDLSMEKVNDFISWYENKQAGSGAASYAINKHDNNIGPFSSRKDYVLYDRILMFEVSEYNN